MVALGGRATHTARQPAGGMAGEQSEELVDDTGLGVEQHVPHLGY